MKIKNLLKEGKLKEVLSSDWGIHTFPLLHIQYHDTLTKYHKGIIKKAQFNLAIEGITNLLSEHKDIDIPLFKIGERVAPSKSCRSLYGDPIAFTITQIKDGEYLTDMYPSIWFEEHELT